MAALLMLVPQSNAIASSQNEPLEREKIQRIESWIESGMESTALPGMSVVIVENGAVIYNRGFGVKNRKGDPVSTSTVFPLASVSKTMTAILILQAASEGLIRLDDSVLDYLPDFRTRNVDLSDKVTIRHLLNQTSGFSGYVGNLHQEDTARRPDALHISVARLREVTLKRAPGSKFEYSNANFDILGLVLETIRDSQFEEIAKQGIFAPLDMNDSFVLAPESPVQDVSERFRYWGPWPTYYDRRLGRGLVASGAAFSSSDDMGKYLIELTSDNPKIFSVAQREDMLAAQGDTSGIVYAKGWFIDNSGAATLAYHDGSIAGATSLIGFVPEKRIGFAILANSSIGLLSGDTRGIEAGIVDILLDRPLREVGSPPLYQSIFWGLVILLLALATWLILFARAWLGGRLKATTLTLLGPAFLLAVLVPALLYGAPLAFGSSLPSLAEFLPDIALFISLGAAVAALLAALRIAVWLKPKLAEKGERKWGA
ncbi:serine hydrolase [Erythrobacter sp. JK5]|uniref:serine hydrolase domain-containing protein n=1 Tax=Erythrobacter sp. JK5 TaxID=2829500 RepID=UPI001BA9D055|nr:serine hydrolase domain-containing protein [Erythrobacter sp. JK5]QUL37617.1 beta-lactamase family protein [Erythrobacter sp. JK5]